MRINYATYISIIRNNEPISFIPFAACVSDKEIKEELIKEFADLDIPLNLVHKCMYDGMLSYEDIYVYIIDVNWGGIIMGWTGTHFYKDIKTIADKK